MKGLVGGPLLVGDLGPPEPPLNPALSLLLYQGVLQRMSYLLKEMGSPQWERQQIISCWQHEVRRFGFTNPFRHGLR